MTQNSPPHPAFPSLRASLILSASGAVVLALAAAVLLVLDHGGHIAPAGAALVACLFAAIVALEPVRRASRDGLQRVAMAVLASFVLRLGLAVVAVAVVVLALSLPVVSVTLWAMLWHLLLLVIEVTLIYQYFGACTARLAAPSGRILPS